MKVGLTLRNFIVIMICLIFLVSSSQPPGNQVEEVRAFTRSIEFDYVTWTLRALFEKVVQSAVGAPRYLSLSEQHRIVTTNLQVVDELDQTTAQIERIYTDPKITDPGQASSKESGLIDQLNKIERQLQPVNETVLQQQVSSILAQEGLTLGGQPVPPVMYHSTPLPLALIISPRNAIQEDANISLEANLTVPEMVALEQAVEKNMDVSALVVPVGGVGIYPTMVMSTTDLNWLTQVISHEWTHNFLTLRPLGLNYETSGALRTMNETTASIVGTEVGAKVIAQYYPELLPPPPLVKSSNEKAAQPAPQPISAPPAFDYRAEMHETRVNVDQMLAAGKIQAAEDYMEARRVMFWDHGYEIRRLNQAYFAFYGAYADVPGGAAGTDPVGPAVRALRAHSSSLFDFLNRISWMTSFKQLQDAVK